MEGGCFCGAIRYRLDGPRNRTTHCHCIHCRRLGGAPFVTWVETTRSGFHVVSGTMAAVESRPGITRRFCASCGTQITYENADTPESVDVTACSLDDPSPVVPEDHVWADRMLPWVKLADGLPRYRKSRKDG
jgi:hypothetical protein